MSVSPSLLSLSFAAEAAEPIIIPSKLSHSRSPSASASSPASEPRPTREPSKRLSSTLATRRRLSDARDAALRPSPSSIIPPSTSVPNARGKMSVSPAVGNLMAGLTLSSSTGSNSSVGTVVREKDSKDKKEGKKGGVDHRCESCDKVYRHPSCLIKHRWEHTPQWRNFPSSTTTAFSPSTSAEGKYNKSGFISKHQQVQLLEAAAILSHLGGGKRGESLPEDRALWPGWVSGNAPLPGASRRVPVTASLGTDAVSSTNGAKGPRMYDFSVPSSAIPVQSSGTGVLTVPARQTSVSYSDSLPSLGWSIPKSAVRGPSSGSGSGSDVEMEEPEDDEEEEDEEDFTGRYSKVSRAPQVEVWEEEMEMEM